MSKLKSLLMSSDSFRMSFSKSSETELADLQIKNVASQEIEDRVSKSFLSVDGVINMHSDAICGSGSGSGGSGSGGSGSGSSGGGW